MYNRIRGCVGRFAQSLAGGKGGEGDERLPAQCEKQQGGGEKGWLGWKIQSQMTCECRRTINRRGWKETCSNNASVKARLWWYRARVPTCDASNSKPSKAIEALPSGSAEDVRMTASLVARPNSAVPHTGAPASRGARPAASPSTDTTLALLVMVSRRCSRARRARW